MIKKDYDKERKIEYEDDEGVLKLGKIPKNRQMCLWSQDNIDCKRLANLGNVFCQKHKDELNKINGRKFNINKEVKEVLIRNE